MTDNTVVNSNEELVLDIQDIYYNSKKRNLIDILAKNIDN